MSQAQERLRDDHLEVVRAGVQPVEQAADRGGRRPRGDRRIEPDDDLVERRFERVALELADRRADGDEDLVLVYFGIAD